MIPYKDYCVTRAEELVKVKRTAGGDSRAGLETTPYECYQVDFSPRRIDLNHFPYNAWGKVAKNTPTDDSKELFLTRDPQGGMALWGAIRGYLHSTRGVNCNQEQVIMDMGNEYLLMLLSRIPGTEYMIAMGSPTHKQAYLVLNNLGYPVVPMEVDRYGSNAKLLEESGADVVYMMPSH